MATNRANLEAALASLSAKIAEAAADPKPNYSVDGQTVSWGDYLKQLQDAYNRTEQMLIVDEPFEIESQVL